MTLNRGMLILFGFVSLATVSLSGGRDNNQATNRPTLEGSTQELSPQTPSLSSQHIINASQMITIPIYTIHPPMIDHITADIMPNVSTISYTTPAHTIPRHSLEEATIETNVLVTPDTKLSGNVTESLGQVSEERRASINVVRVLAKPKHLASQKSSSRISPNSAISSVIDPSNRNQEVRCQIEKDGDIWWNERKVGTLAVQPCTNGYHGNIYRRCYMGGIWDTPDYTDCKLERLQRLGRLVLYHLHRRLLTGLYHLAEELADYLPVANILSPVDRLQTLEVLEKMTTADVNLRTDSDSDVAYVADLLQCADELLMRKVVIFSTSSERNILLSKKSSQVILGLAVLARKALGSLLSAERRALVFRSSQNIVMSLFSKQTSIDHIWPRKNSTEDEEGAFPRFLNIAYSDVENMAFAFIWIQNLGKLLDTAKMILNSDVVVATAITTISSGAIPFEVTLKMNKEAERDNHVHKCATLHNSTSIWATDVCNIVNRRKKSVTCHCQDLVAVALVLEKSKEMVKGFQTAPFSRAIVVSCGISLVAVMLTFIAHLHRCRKNCPESSPILLNLLIAMATIQVVFMAGINATQHEEICYSVSITLHYLFLVASFWMVSFTVQLYRRLKHSSQQTRRPMRGYFFFSWTVPVALVTVSYIINPRGYETRRYCWLSIQRGMLISFIAPISLLIVVNTIFMVLVLKTFFQQRPVTHMSEIEKTRVSLRAGVTLLPFFAVNWFFGVLALEDTSTTIFQYAFAFTNSLQGILIFFFYCCLDAEVRRSIKTKFVRRKRKRRNSAIKLKKGCFLCSREQSVVSLDEEGGKPLLADGPATASLQTDQDHDKLQNFVRGYSV